MLEGRIFLLRTEVSQLETAVSSAESVYHNSQRQVTSARRNLDNARASYEDAASMYNATVTSVNNQLADYATALSTAYDSYVKAMENLDTAKSNAEDTLSDYETSMENAYDSYQSAQTNLESAQASAQNQLQSYRDALNSAYASAGNKTGEVGLRQLRADLATTEITAPASGTVTAVYAEVGSSGAVSFATDVAVLSRDTGLKIGMSVRLNFVLDEAKDVLSVPYEAVYQNSSGQSCVLAAGLENDLDIEIEGTGLADGMRIVSEPDAYLSWVDQAVKAGETAQTFPGMMGGF